MFCRYRLLRGRAPTQVGPARVEHNRVVRRFQQLAESPASMSWSVVFGDGALGDLVEGLQQLHGLRGLGLGAVHLELLMPMRNADLQRLFDGAQVGVGRATQVGEPGVVVWE